MAGSIRDSVVWEPGLWDLLLEVTLESLLLKSRAALVLSVRGTSRASLR